MITDAVVFVETLPYKSVRRRRPMGWFASATGFTLTDVITGVVVSRAVSVNVLVEALPAPSVAVAVTVYTPIANTLPDACEGAGRH